MDVTSHGRLQEEHFFDVESFWELLAYVGADPADNVAIQSQESVREVVATGSKDSPPVPPWDTELDVDVSWLLARLQEGETGKGEGEGEGEERGSGGAEAEAEAEGASTGSTVAFAVDRDAATTLTPRRNAEVDAAVKHGHALAKWSP